MRYKKTIYVLKNYFYFVAFLLFLFSINSCSSDSNLNGSEQNLLKMIKRDFYNNTTIELEGRIVAVFENGKQISDSTFNLQGEVQLYRHFEYLNGKYSSFQVYWNNQIYKEHKVFYDSQDRIFKSVNIDHESNSNITKNYTFNTDNTISTEVNENGSVTNETFFINDDNIIYKIVSEFENREITFDENFNSLNLEINYTPQFGLHTTTNIAVTYDSQNIPSEDYFRLNNYGIYKHNGNLSSGTVGLANWHGNKHSIKLTQTHTSGPGSVTEYVYTFNEQNLPLTKKTYINSILKSDDIYIYE